MHVRFSDRRLQAYVSASGALLGLDSVFKFMCQYTSHIFFVKVNPDDEGRRVLS